MKAISVVQSKYALARLVIVPGLKVLCLGFVMTAVMLAQQPVTSNPAEGPMGQPGRMQPLSDLLAEVENTNPEIQAAIHGYEAARQVPKSAGALPDTEVTLQQFSVGSPRPFAGYTNSEFAYVGIGVAQQIPYPGKRRLRAETANREAESMQADAETVRRDIIEKIKVAYFRLAYLQQTLSILERDDRLLGDIEQIVESRYRVGQGNQQEVLKAQLQHTKILQEITHHHREAGQLQAQLKQLLNRAQDSPDIVTAPLVMRRLGYSADELLKLAQEQNPQVKSREALLKTSQSQVNLARLGFRPDFNVQYMYQNTDRKFRDYYMASFSINLPNRGRRSAELAEAVSKQAQAEQQLRAEVQQQFAEIQDQYVFAQTSAEQLKIYKEGLIPQSEATFRAAQAAYQSNRQDFETLMNSFLDVLKLEIDYQQQLAEHETALARIESLTGVTVQ